MSNPIVGFDTPAGWFGVNGYFTMPTANYEVELKDGVTGYNGDGDYVVTFTCDELAVYGVGAHAPAIHVIGRPASNPIASPYDMRVHKMAQYLVLGGVLMGSRDLRVLGGVNSSNIDPAVIANAVGNTINIQGLSPIEVDGGTSGTNYTVQIIDPLPIINGGTGTTNPSLTAGPGISLSNPWPDTEISSTGILSVTGSAPISSSGGQNPVISMDTPLPIADGGTGTSSPGLIAGPSVTIDGAWPDQTVSVAPFTDAGTQSYLTGSGVFTQVYYTTAGTWKLLREEFVSNFNGTMTVMFNDNPPGTTVTINGQGFCWAGICNVAGPTNSMVTITYTTSTDAIGYFKDTSTEYGATAGF